MIGFPLKVDRCSYLDVSIRNCTKKLIHRAFVAIILVGRRWRIRFDQGRGQFGTTSPVGTMKEIVRNILNLDR